VEAVWERAILHADMDAFYAAVECLDDPSLRGLPVVIGGLGPRGVVATASYEARQFGVHSAMPVARARRLCPQARFIRPRGARYRAKSREVFDVFHSFTPHVEGLSLDEAFLDVTHSQKLFGPPPAIAALLKNAVYQKTGLRVSVGVAHNKFLAKLASDADKPDGLYVVKPEQVHEFLDPLPIARMWGIGKRTAPRLRKLGILTIGQLRVAEPGLLKEALGSRAMHFLSLARGEDDREVVSKRADKSISREVTFDTSIENRDELLAELQRQAESVASRLRNRGLLARTVTVKLRDDSFRTMTRSKSMVAPSNSTRTLYRMARALFESWRKDHRSTPLRLLGLGTSGLEPETHYAHDEGDLAESRAEQGIDRVADEINRRFGVAGIVHAQTLKRGG
jgi:DNA polymerase-4